MVVSLGKNLSLNAPYENKRIGRKHVLKSSVFGEYGDGHKLEAISVNFRTKTIIGLDSFFASYGLNRPKTHFMLLSL
jgi:hypothetical protein